MAEPLTPEVLILNTALELPASERAAYLDTACAGDGLLRRRIESLLEAHAQARGFLTTADLGSIRATSDYAPSIEKVGDCIGRYKLIELIGEGGCGSVYKASQEEPVRRQVALKVIKLGMDTKQVIARFEAERQALALMDHPNIARVLDAGATDAGRPYFVMELVSGIRITQFCEEHQLSLEDRLRLFIDVCRAIQHAHHKGIVHRDIKPSNILVAAHDGVAVPKVIDFGIAKATQGKLTEQTVLTTLQLFVGTPAYMSPEQAQATETDIDTRSDIYSLGVLLYEMLTGRTPFDQQELLSQGVDEMRRTIREREPLKPSLVIGRRSAGALQTGAVSDGPPEGTAARVFRALPTDLDWIVMKCLEKDRARRYQTANGLAADLQRLLDHEPVSARPPSRLYRLQKLAQRNKVTFVASTFLILALLAVAIASSVAAWRVAGARRAEQNERQKSESANRQLRQTVSLLELERVEDFFNAHDAASGVAHLSAMLRQDPSNSIVATRLVAALTQRGWAVPAGRPMQHAGHVPTALFSPDGQRVLTASWDGTAVVWDITEGNKLFTLRHADTIYTAQYSPDGRRILTASADGTAQICDAETGRVERSLRHADKVHWAEFSRDGALVVTACADRVARIWNAETGELKRELRGHSRPIVIARFAPDAKLVASATDWGGLRMWSVESGEMVFKLVGHKDFTGIETLDFSPDGRWLVTGGYDRTAWVWNVATGKAIGPPLMHRLRVWHAEFSPDGNLLLTTCEDGTARLWDTKTMRAFGEPLRHESGVISGQFSPDGQRVVTTSSDNTARVWDVATQTPLCQPLRHLRRVLTARFSWDGRRLVTGSADGATQTWELRRPLEPSARIRHDRNVAPIAVSRDGAALLTAGQDKTLRLWNLPGGEPASDSMPQETFIACADFAPDGRRTAVAFVDYKIWVLDFGDWKLRSGTLARPRVAAGPMQHEGKIRSVQFNADGSSILSVSDRAASVWDAATGKLITALVHRAEVTAAQFSPDGSKVVTASEDFTGQIWDAKTGERLVGPLSHFDHVKWAEFSPTGEKVMTASTDNTACLWDARTGQRLLTLQHARIVEHAAFSPDGRRVVTSCLDRTAQIWDAETGQALTPPLRHGVPVVRASFNVDGQRILTSSWSDPSVASRVWDSETGRPLTEWLRVDGHWGTTVFDLSEGRVIMGTKSGIASVWHLPKIPLPVPEWFPEFVEALGGLRLGALGNVELVYGPELDQIVMELAKEPDGFYERLARRVLAEQIETPAPPF